MAPCLVGVVLLGGLATGCGGSGGMTVGGPPPARTSRSAGSALDTWKTATQAICRQKRTAIANLGSVHITYGGIARLGLPAVRRLLDGYLGRLLAILRHYAQRQHALGTPASVASIMARVRALDGELQAATVHLRAVLTHVTTAAGLSAVFRNWLVSIQKLGARGEALARQLNLPACETTGAGAGSPTGSAA